MEPKYCKQVTENRAMSILFHVHIILPGELFFSFSLHIYVFSGSFEITVIPILANLWSHLLVFQLTHESHSICAHFLNHISTWNMQQHLLYHQTTFLNHRGFVTGTPVRELFIKTGKYRHVSQPLLSRDDRMVSVFLLSYLGNTSFG